MLDELLGPMERLGVPDRLPPVLLDLQENKDWRHSLASITTKNFKFFLCRPLFGSVYTCFSEVNFPVRVSRNHWPFVLKLVLHFLEIVRLTTLWTGGTEKLQFLFFFDWRFEFQDDTEWKFLEFLDLPKNSAKSQVVKNENILKKKCPKIYLKRLSSSK